MRLLRPVGIAIVIAATVASILWPLAGADDGTLYDLTQVAVSVIFASGVAFVIGHAGVPTFGNQVFLGGGAYAVAEICNHSGVDNVLVFLVAGLGIGVVTGAVVGLLLRRVGGLAFGMVTLAVGQVSYIYVFQSNLLGGALGLYGVRPGAIFGRSLGTTRDQFVLAWIVMALVIVAIVAVRRSRLGTVLVAARDSPSRASAIGIRIYRYRLGALIFGASICGLAGALTATSVGAVDPSLFFWTSGALPVLAGLVGGMSTVVGPIAGAILIEWLTIWVSRGTTSWLLIEGVLVLGLYLAWPDGVFGNWRVVARAVMARTGRGKDSAARSHHPGAHADDADKALGSVMSVGSERSP